jgi:hypothetical protein
MVQDPVMTNGANGKILSRLAAVLFMAMAFAGCALMLSAGNDSLFAEGLYGGEQQAARR